MIQIDGSYGEGGGQILRTALALSCLTQKPFEITNIRAGRCESGLKPQHFYCVKGLEKLCSAKTEGAEIGSEKVSFEPGKMASKSFELDVGTAGSVTLLLQSMLLPAYFAEKSIKIKLIGGTDVNWSQPVDYLKEVLMPQLSKFCEKAELKVSKRGYYPAGGGVVELAIKPKYKLADYSNFDDFLKAIRQSEPKINLIAQGKLIAINGLSHASKSLENARVAERQAESAKRELTREIKNLKLNILPNIRIEYSNTPSVGSGITLWAVYSKDGIETDPLNPIIIGADALGAKGKPAETVGAEAAKNLVEQMNSKVPVDEHLVDNLIPWLALLPGSKIKAAKLTKHALTNIYVVEKFLGKSFDVDESKKIISSC